MHTNYDVTKLLRYIKALPIAIVISFSALTTYLVLNSNIEKHKENLANIKEEYILTQKMIIKQEVLRTIKQINYQKNTAEIKLKKEVKRKVTIVSNIISNIYKENKHKTKKEITKLIKDAIRPITFSGGRGYFFIYTMDGTNVLYPTAPDYEGKNFWNQKDDRGGYSIRELSKIAQEQGEGFLKWYWFKPNQNRVLETRMYKKLGYVKKVNELNWFIGTGEYIDEFENEIKQELIKEIRQIRFGKNGYIFLHQYDGLCLSHLYKEKIGENHINLKDSKGNYTFQKVLKVAQSGGGYLQYEASANPTTLVSEQKISYINAIDDWGWSIGAGAYLGDINKIIEKKEREFQERIQTTIIRIVISSFLLTVVLLFITIKLLNRIEQEFQTYEESLSKEIDENHKKDKLLSEQAKMASMGEMIANIAHQWRQPLSVISTAATGMKMQKEYGCLSDDIFENTCDAINNNAQYLSNTIDDFKNFIKGESTTKRFDVTHSVNSFLHLVEGSLKNHNINVILNLEEKLVIQGHENELTQCLMNIFNNAKDALSNVSEEEREFYITTRKEEDFVIIELKDNAGGIQKDILPHIFEPYFTTKHKAQGTGLGLHMTYNLIVQGMNGTISASTVEYMDSKNKKVQGALFIIKLPVK